MRQTLTDKRGRPLKQMSLQKRVELRKLYKAQTPRWRHPLAGYLASIPIVGLGLLLLVLARMIFTNNFVFPGMPMVLAVLVVSLFWGVGPALFSVLLGAVALDYFALPPLEQFDLTTSSGLVQVLPFVVVGCIIAFITAQREAARMRGLIAEEEAIERADELERVNKQLEQANHLKDQFLSMASHELKTPITTIRGQAQIALRRMSKQGDLSKEQATTSEALRKIDEQTQRLNSLVDDLLDLSSIRAGKVGLQLQQCDLVEVCREVVEDQRLLTNRVIELQTPGEAVTLRGDCNRLGQVVVNLLSNALKYSAEEQPVCVHLQRNDAKAVIIVRDYGKGIAGDQQKQIFEPFYRTPDAQTSSKRGMGLGLAICKDIVERHSGRIWCDSTPGEGTIFTVELPLR